MSFCKLQIPLSIDIGGKYICSTSQGSSLSVSYGSFHRHSGVIVATLEQEVGYLQSYQVKIKEENVIAVCVLVTSVPSRRYTRTVVAKGSALQCTTRHMVQVSFFCCHAFAAQSTSIGVP